MMRDPEFGPVRIRAFGTYVVRVVEPAKFIAQIVGTNGVFKTGDVDEQLRSQVTSRFVDAVAESKIPVLDLAANYDEVGGQIRSKMAAEFSEWGIELTQFVIESIALPMSLISTCPRVSFAVYCAFSVSGTFSRSRGASAL